MKYITYCLQMGALISKICVCDQIHGAKPEQDKTVQNSNASKPEKDETLQNVKILQPIPGPEVINPHKFDEILKKADNPILGDLKDKVRTGIFLDQKKKKFWVEENGHNCFMLFARDLTIGWGEDKKYFRWISVHETSDTKIEVAELVKIIWLEICGKFEVSLLTPNITYQVLFIIKIKKLNSGWTSTPVKLELKLPNGQYQKYQEKLDKKPKGQWIQIKAGEFETRDAEGDIKIDLLEWDNPNWKRGLIIKGVMICPK
ncbi:hypothetical protein LUZ60_002288 [Juncus effusus]|nr:hypothetical protein LUZ60_002288 [Juncus effusus]